jgi:glutathione synthase/RimK-type ligase-like ATP-grasp enzyme
VRLVLYPYLFGSHSARDLARSLDCIRVREVGHYVPRPRDIIVNWGNPRIPGWWNANARANVLNQPEEIRRAINKIATFRALRDAGVPIPDFAVNRGDAARFFRSDRSRVLCRSVLDGHSGRGIRIANTAAELTNVPLYVKYVPKEAEYRFHILNGEIIDTEQKRRRNGVEQNDTERLIRSHRNGWVFTRNDIRRPVDACRQAALDAVRALGLQFGAVDIGYHSRHGTKVYEVNTAPGIEGTTLEIYTRELRRLAAAGNYR